MKAGEPNPRLLEVRRLAGISERKSFSFSEGSGCSFFLTSEPALLDVRELGSVEAGKGLSLEEIGFRFELKFLAGVLPLVVMLLLEGEAPRLNPDRTGEVPLPVMLLTEGDGALKVPPRAGDVPLTEGPLEGDTPRTSGFVGPAVVDEMDGLDVISGRFEIVPVLCRRCGEENTVEALVNVGWEDFTTDADLAAEAVVARVTELDLVVDGELERIGLVIRRGEEDFTAEAVEVGEEEPFDETAFGLGLFVEVLKAGRGLLEVPGL